MPSARAPRSSPRGASEAREPPAASAVPCTAPLGHAAARGVSMPHHAAPAVPRGASDVPDAQPACAVSAIAVRMPALDPRQPRPRADASPSRTTAPPRPAQARPGSDRLRTPVAFLHSAFCFCVPETRHPLRRPGRQRAGLVEHNRIHLRHAFEHERVLQEDLHPGQQPLRRAQREGRRQRQRARARHDQHRGERLQPPAPHRPTASPEHRRPDGDRDDDPA